MPVVQCPFCNLVWSPRVLSPRWCPRCKVWVKGKTKEVTDTDDWFESRRRPIWEKKGELITVEQPRACNICGKLFKRLIRLSEQLWCKHCLFRLLDETEEMVH